jgi:LacI family transcriptional regulator
MTTGLLLALRQSGLRVPEDISLISFDDLPYFSLLEYPLTSVLQPMYELGECACNLLLDMLEAGQEDTPSKAHIRLSAKLVLRDSCRPVH